VSWPTNREGREISPSFTFAHYAVTSNGLKLAQCANNLYEFKSRRNMPTRPCGVRGGETAVGLAGVVSGMRALVSPVSHTPHRKMGVVVGNRRGRS